MRLLPDSSVSAVSIEVVQIYADILSSQFSSRLLVLVLITLPAVLLFLLPEGGIAGALWFWLLALLTIVVLWVVVGRPADTDHAAAAPRPRAIDPDDQPESVRPIMPIDESIEDPSGVRVFRGH